MAGRHRLSRREAANYPPADKRTSADVVWQYVKELNANDLCSREYLIRKFKASPTKHILAINWLRKKGYIVVNGGLIALSTQGRAFHNARLSLQDRVQEDRT